MLTDLPATMSFIDGLQKRGRSAQPCVSHYHVLLFTQPLLRMRPVKVDVTLVETKSFWGAPMEEHVRNKFEDCCNG